MTKPPRLAAIEALPADMQDYALVDWETAALVLNSKDPEHTRETLKKAGLPVVDLGGRRKLPTWGNLRALIKSRQAATA